MKEIVDNREQGKQGAGTTGSRDNREGNEAKDEKIEVLFPSVWFMTSQI